MALRQQLGALGALGDAAAEFASSLLPISSADSAALPAASDGPLSDAAARSFADGIAHAQAFAPQVPSHFQHRRHLSQQEHAVMMHHQQQYPGVLQLEQEHMMQNRASGPTALDASTAAGPSLPQASARPPVVRKRSASASVTMSSNPKSDAQKDRVAMACTHCRTRKVRCDGDQPACGLCTRLGRPCNYNRVSEAENMLLRARKRALKVKRASEKKNAEAQDPADDADETMMDAPGGSQDEPAEARSARRRSRVSNAGPYSSSATDTLSGSRSRSTSVNDSTSPAMTSAENFASGVMMPWQSSPIQLTSAPGSPTALDMSASVLPTWLTRPAFGDTAPHSTAVPHVTFAAQSENSAAWAGPQQQQQQQMQQYAYGTQGAFGSSGTASRPPAVPYPAGGSSLIGTSWSGHNSAGSWRSAGSWSSTPYGSTDPSDSAPSSLSQRRAVAHAVSGQPATQELQLHMSSQPDVNAANLAAGSQGFTPADLSMQDAQGNGAGSSANSPADRVNPYDLRLPTAVVQNAAEQWRQSMGYSKAEYSGLPDVSAGPHGDGTAAHDLSNEALRPQRFGDFTLQEPANMPPPQPSQQDHGAGNLVLDMPKLTHQGAGGWAAAMASSGKSSLMADPMAAARAATTSGIQWTSDESGSQGFGLFDQHSQGH